MDEMAVGTSVMASSSPKVDISQQIKLLFEHMDRQIDLADRKAQLILAANTFMAATLGNLSQGAGLKLLAATAPLAQRIESGCAVVLVATLVLSVYYALLVARPRLTVAGQRRTLLYAGHIAAWTEQDYVATFLAQTPREMDEAVLAQVHSRAQIANRKFVGIRWSLDFLFVAFLAWATIRLMIAFFP